MRRHSLTILVTTLNAFVCPGGVTEVELEGWGGGASGSSGGHADNTQNVFAVGGPGGGGALMYKVRVPVTPGVSYDAVIGAGGPGTVNVAGIASTIPNKGTNGGDTLFRVNGGSTLATFQGAQAPGSAATSGVSANTAVIPGGSPTQQKAVGTAGDLTQSTGYFMSTDYQVDRAPHVPSMGGAGCTNANYGRAGQDSPQGFAGGTAAFNAVTPGGINSAGYKGGGCGGGGGAGPGGDGGNGGQGGDAGGAGSFGQGGVGANDGAANSGAGGGGGGGAGAGGLSGGGSTGGTSGAGGSGKLTIVWYV